MPAPPFPLLLISGWTHFKPKDRLLSPCRPQTTRLFIQSHKGVKKVGVTSHVLYIPIGEGSSAAFYERCERGGASVGSTDTVWFFVHGFFLCVCVCKGKRTHTRLSGVVSSLPFFDLIFFLRVASFLFELCFLWSDKVKFSFLHGEGDLLCIWIIFFSVTVNTWHCGLQKEAIYCLHSTITWLTLYWAQGTQTGSTGDGKNPPPPNTSEFLLHLAILPI